MTVLFEDVGYKALSVPLVVEQGLLAPCHRHTAIAPPPMNRSPRSQPNSFGRQQPDHAP